ncbi:MAG: hypothetical protein M0P74_04695 [Syntrophales bacterium]|jgi:hypothetical protein|nr:hypothetical protein [Syntrophales bacterium]
MEIHLGVFKGKRIWQEPHNGEWWFSMIYIAGEMSGSERPGKYCSDLQKNISVEGPSELFEEIGQLTMKSADGKFYENDCAVPNLRIGDRVVNENKQ